MISEAKARATEELDAAKKLLAIKKSRHDLISYTKFTMPDATDPEDAGKSLFQPARHHQQIAEALEKLERGVIRRLIITMPPRHGKSELCTRKFPAWFAGRNPGAQIIIAGYSETFAKEEFGTEILATMQGKRHEMVFPACTPVHGSANTSFIRTTLRNKISITGVGGKMTGKGADLLIIDDPIKGAEDADSTAARNKAWKWYQANANTRLMPGGRILIVMTRWHEDDLVGRITDPEGEVSGDFHNWTVLHMPATNDEETQALWPEWWPIEVLLATKASMTPRVWNCLYQGRPTAMEGDYFRRAMLKTYTPEELRRAGPMRYYIGMDLSVSVETRLDASAVVVVGIDQHDVIWVMPDTIWERLRADDVVDAIIDRIEANSPLIVWGEKGQISKAVGPFLQKRMQERKVYSYIDEVAPSAKKDIRATSIRGRMSMGMVRFPKFAPWYQEMEEEFLKFPNGRHDDFVDAMSLIGLGLDREIGANKPKQIQVNVMPKQGTVPWMRYRSDQEKKQKKINTYGGW